ncbi:MAG: hypothetical protein GF401_01365 [Chitinivibrionales bacterium]|nr:hypothetical protein [Chitinivibrionales bacterium]
MIFLLTSLIFSCSFFVGCNNASSLSCDSLLLGTVKQGDIIFLEGRTLRGTAVRVLEPGGNPLSHLGIIVLSEKGCDIVHADPTHQRDGKAKVTREPLSSLLRRQKIGRYSLYRPSDTHRASRAAQWAQYQVNTHTPFDNAFDLESDTALYCTELVWKAYLNAGVDISGGKRDTIPTPLGTLQVLFPIRIMKSTKLKHILSYP